MRKKEDCLQCRLQRLKSNLFFVSIIVEQLILAPSTAYQLPAPEDVLIDVNEQTPLLNNEGSDDNDRLVRPKVLQQRRTSNFDSSFSRVYFSNDSATHFKRALPEDDEDALDTYDDDNDGVPNGSGKKGKVVEDQDPITGVLWGKTAFQQICTSWFWLPQLFLTCYMLRINYEIATVFDQVLYYTNELELAEKVTDAFVLLLPLGGVVSIPFIGYVLDSLSSMAAFIVLLLLGLGYGAFCMTTLVPAQLAGITLFTIMRPLM